MNATMVLPGTRFTEKMSNAQDRWSRAEDLRQLTQLDVARANADGANSDEELGETAIVSGIRSADCVNGRSTMRAAFADALTVDVSFKVGAQCLVPVAGDRMPPLAQRAAGSITFEVANRQGAGSWRRVIGHPTIDR